MDMAQVHWLSGPKPAFQRSLICIGLIPCSSLSYALRNVHGCPLEMSSTIEVNISGGIIQSKIKPLRVEIMPKMTDLFTMRVTVVFMVAHMEVV
jgi:hypothetical protein